MTHFSIVVAVDLMNGIGKNNTIPWNLKEDMAYFQKMTTISVDPSKKQNAVIMGKNTYLSLPEQFRPLPNRYNIVISSTLRDDKITIFKSLDEALNHLNHDDIAQSIDQIFVIGGTQLYKEAILHPLCHLVHITKLYSKYDADTFFPDLPATFKLRTSTKILQSSNGINYNFNEYVSNTLSISLIDKVLIKMMAHFNIIVATDYDNGIGLSKSNSLPWTLKEDMVYFQKITTKLYRPTRQLNAVIMGKNTYLSIPEKFRPLPNRLNIVISSTYVDSKVLICKSLNEALLFVNTRLDVDQVFVIGGGQLYNEAIHHPHCQAIYLTRIYNSFDCDIKFPAIPDTFTLGREEKICRSKNNLFFQYQIYTPTRYVGEHQYLYIMNKILTDGTHKIDRTNVGIRYLFGANMEFDLSDNKIPLLTTKRVFFRGVFEELMFFLSGKTDAGILKAKNVNIWNDNTTTEFLEKNKLKNAGDGFPNYDENDMGPTYGFNFRHYGADYKGKDHDYTNQGYDQLTWVIEQIQNSSTSRRLMINLWNTNISKYNKSSNGRIATVLDEMSLPPCLFNYIFDVNNDIVNLLITMRSADWFLGVPFNLASAALFLRLICIVCNKKPGKLIYNGANVHIYDNHIDQCKEQGTRIPRGFPTLQIYKKTNNIHDFTFNDLKLIDYDCHPMITAKMAV